MSTEYLDSWILGFWDSGILGFWDLGIWGFWDLGILGFGDFEFWIFGFLDLPPMLANGSPMPGARSRFGGVPSPWGAVTLCGEGSGWGRTEVTNPRRLPTE